MTVTHGEELDALPEEKIVPKLPTQLTRIGAVYKFRARIPQDLLASYAPKREIVESLNTKDLAVAKRRLPTVQKRHQDEWERRRQALFESKLKTPLQMDAGNLTPPRQLPINEETIRYLTSLLAHDSLAGDEQTRLAGNYTLEEIQEYRERLAESIDWIRDMVSIGDTQSLLPSALQLLSFKNIEVTGSEEEYRRLSLAYARTALQTNEALLKQMSGQVVERPEVQLPAVLSKPKIPLYSLFEYWRDRVKGRPQRTIDDVERHIKAFDEMTGHKSAERLTRSDFIAYRDLRLTQVESANTVAKDLSFLKAVMQQALEAEKIPSNPAALIKVTRAKGATKAKRNLNEEDLNVLFSSAIYTIQRKRPRGGAGEAAAWVPLIALYTGSRIEEICQLTVTDVVTKAKIPHLRMQLILDKADIAQGIEKKLKNDSSRRSVPIHQKLLDAGFLAYVESMRQQNQTWLFPHLVPDRYEQRSGNLSKWWGRWRRTLGIDGEHRCFHAFRHVFKTACRGALIGEEFHDAITGHAATSEGRNYGDFPLDAINTQLQKVAYPELAFDWVWQPLEGCPSDKKASQAKKLLPARRAPAQSMQCSAPPGNGTKIYFDAEFSSLTNSAELISLGAITEAGETFYAEIDPLPERCSDFVKTTVLPLLTGPKCSANDFVRQLTEWLGQFQQPVLFADSVWDILVLRRLVEGIPGKQSGELALPAGNPIVSLSITPTVDASLRALYKKTIVGHFELDPRQHHALVDAQALRAGQLAISSRQSDGKH